MSTQPENLSAYLDGELSPEEVAELEAALDADPELRAELEMLEGAVDFVRSHGPLEAPVGFADAVLAKVAEEPAPSGGTLVWLRRPMGVPLEALAVAAAALFVLVFALNSGDESPSAAAKREVSEPEKTAAAWAPAEPAPEPKEAEEADEDAVAQAQVPLKKDGSRLKEALTTRGSAPKPRPAPKAAPVLSTEEVAALSEKGSAEGEAEPVVTEPGYGGTSGMTRVPFSYTLSTQDANVLKQLDVLARRFGGRLENARGEAYPVASMSAGTQQIFVRLPNTQMSNFGAELAKLGEVHLADANDMVASSEVTLEIRVDYEPGTTTYEPSSYEKK
ncbi:MAG: hypothetical protein EP330_27195 [Deltaproteobacteria bacterium]|nr:MAG: hypothetical protein EP330_27195 [Deltaproteobacteria bacterium]